MTMMTKNSNNGVDSTSKLTFGEAMQPHQEKRKLKIEHPYALSTCALCVVENVREDARNCLDESLCDAIKEVVRCLHLPPCPNTKVQLSLMTPSDIADNSEMHLRHSN